jgi:hypothetical protein
VPQSCVRPLAASPGPADDDRARQNELVAARWTVFRVTKTMLDADPAGAFRPVAAVLARNSPDAANGA